MWGGLWMRRYAERRFLRILEETFDIISFMWVHWDTLENSRGHQEMGVVLGNVLVQITFPKYLFTQRTPYGHIQTGSWRFRIFPVCRLPSTFVCWYPGLLGFVFWTNLQLCVRLLDQLKILCQNMLQVQEVDQYRSVSNTNPPPPDTKDTTITPLICSNDMFEPRVRTRISTLVLLRVHASTQAATGTCTHLASYSVGVQLIPQAQDLLNRPQAQCLPWATLQNVPHGKLACTRVSKNASNFNPRSHQTSAADLSALFLPLCVSWFEMFVDDGLISTVAKFAANFLVLEPK